MKVYLAELVHTYVDRLGRAREDWGITVPLGVGYVAAAVKQRLPGIDVSLFRDPEELLAAVDHAPPDLVGFGFNCWNTDLSQRALQLIKRECPRVVTVAGGPSVDDSDEQLLAFLGSFAMIDYAVPSEGENGFIALLQHLGQGGSRDGRIVPGVAYLDPARALVRGPYTPPYVRGDDPPQVEDQEAVASPYLDGSLDTFLDRGYVPIVQTMRGCPYRCEFCVSGTALWSRPRGFGLERVKAELDYALERSGSGDLILTDENWGLLGERDIELARYIRERSLRTGKPQRVYYYTAKNVNEASRIIAEIIAPIAWNFDFSMSYQTINPESRKAIKRTNITLDKAAVNAQWARERGLFTSSEMIYGFPYETVDTFLDGIETLVKAGIEKVRIYLLMLFPGIELYSAKARAEYGLKTRFRQADYNACGVYRNGDLVAVETEEIVVSTKWSTFEDYLKIRRYYFFAYSLITNELLLDLTNLCKAVGTSTESLVRHVVQADYGRRPALGAILADFDRAAQDEFRDTHEEVYEMVAAKLRSPSGMDPVKVNRVFHDRMLESPQAVADLVDIVDEYVTGLFHGHPLSEVVTTYVREVLPHCISLLCRSLDQTVRFSSRFDYVAFSRQEFSHPSALLLERPAEFEGKLQRGVVKRDRAPDVAAISRVLVDPQAIPR